MAQGGFKVELVVDEHSCDSNWRSQNEAQTKALVKEKIAELRRQINLSAMAPAGRSAEYATATQLKAEIDLLLSTVRLLSCFSTCLIVRYLILRFFTSRHLLSSFHLPFTPSHQNERCLSTSTLSLDNAALALRALLPQLISIA